MKNWNAPRARNGHYENREWGQFQTSCESSSIESFSTSEVSGKRAPGAPEPEQAAGVSQEPTQSGQDSVWLACQLAASPQGNVRHLSKIASCAAAPAAKWKNKKFWKGYNNYLESYASFK